ncbi:restriction endonuclease [Bradyrhizobium sp. SZCCHNR1015]|uniref:restriction endonuclease n=1 Tax=Bradyrhizobium sp. SZCCHNR1015 TaxID=3057338 RepID=UPI002916C800|nr:restriction endonuclease [Bradyrhizobium sp. SZCCHNR1015]
MEVQHQVRLPLPRGHYDVDVFAEETIEGITYRILCECKNWRTKVPQEKVHAFRTIMQETGANRGYIVSRTGFQAGAIEAAQATNIELVTYAQFQEM